MSSSSPLNSRLQDAVAGHNAKSGIGALQKAAGVHPGEQHLIERGYVPVRQITGKVVGVWGDAHIRLLDGTVTPLLVGDVVRKGVVVLTSQDGIVQLEAHPTRLAGASDDVERTITQVGNGDIDNPATTNLLFEISPALGFVGAPLQLDTGSPGALFGIAATVDGSGNQIVYFNDDNDNSVKVLSK